MYVMMLFNPNQCWKEKFHLVPAFDSVLRHLRTELLFAEKRIQRDSFTRSLKFNCKRKLLKQDKKKLICALIHAVKAYHQNIVDPQHLFKGVGHEMG